MDYLSMLSGNESANKPSPPTAKTVKSLLAVKTVPGGSVFLQPLDASAPYRLDYTNADLAEFDALIDRYCALLQRPDKRGPMLAARRRMRPAIAAAELAEFRALVAATPTTKDDDYGR
jgi:hypothetical protein